MNVNKKKMLVYEIASEIAIVKFFLSSILSSGKLTELGEKHLKLVIFRDWIIWRTM